MEDISKDLQMRPRPLAVAIGLSAGGLAALGILLPMIPAGFAPPVIIVQHLHPLQDCAFIEILRRSCALPLKEAEEKEKVSPGVIYFAPANYHLLIEPDHTFSLSVDEKVNFSRPSIDVLFESASDVYRGGLIGIILTGAGTDGALGLRRIKEKGGLTIIQDPKTAEFPMMPASALNEVEPDYVLSTPEIAALLVEFGRPAAGRSPLS